MDFGLEDLQEAIDAPTVHSLHMPSSFFPRIAQLGVAAVESRIPADVIAGLEALGHRVQDSGPWSHGRVMAVTHDPSRRLFEAAASPRGETAYAIALP